MSTQPTGLPKVAATVIADPKIPHATNTSTGRSACATRFSSASVLDGPWKVTILPEPPPLPPGVLPAPDPHAVKSQPWRRGDVTRLKDDSPKGMMEYIATHTKGWWQELAERALRDNEKAERLVREAGWQPGQCWALEVDAEAKQKLLEAEEAKRQREEAERSREAAEKEAFMQRQMELLKKAGRAPRCEYLYTDGRGCRAPQVKGERWCHGHAKAMSYRPEQLEMELMEDEQAVMVNLYRVTKSLLAGRISEKTAGLMLWSAAIGAPGAKGVRKTYHGGTETRRKGKSLPRIHADDRGSEKRLTKTKTFETQRKGGSRGGQSHAGVTKCKPFKSGIDGRSTHAFQEKQTRENAFHPSKPKSGLPGTPALKRHGRTQHSRDVSTAPHSPSQAQGRSESLNMTRGEGRRGASEHRQVGNKSQTSASPRLRGGPSSSIRMYPRQCTVGSCPASAPPW